ncbi:MAG TPA: dihydroorotate dehydrogenase electron transfer subunit [Thermoplasmata archaeon]|nr:MAG TPA: dihydroorotate dehydrogenase electron transfer subunit [Thermoplasmata archaeon]
MPMNIPAITTILKSSAEATDIKTITFRYPGAVLPGQFFMIWIPGIDEIPMSVSLITETINAITFRKIGDATDALYGLGKGDKIGVRGPYGNGFTIRGKRLLFVGGGTGIAMLAPAVEQAAKKKLKSTVIIGAKTKNELFFEDRLRRIGATVLVSTDDGSAGYKGYASDLAKEILKKGSIDAVYTCGPEPMMKTLLSSCKTIPFQASLERYMKCALGICGQCCVGAGLRICVDGPIFDGATLKKIEDFGVFQRDAAGRKILF